MQSLTPTDAQTEGRLDAILQKRIDRWYSGELLGGFLRLVRSGRPSFLQDGAKEAPPVRHHCM